MRIRVRETDHVNTYANELEDPKELAVKLNEYIKVTGSGRKNSASLQDDMLVISVEGRWMDEKFDNGVKSISIFGSDGLKLQLLERGQSIVDIEVSGNGKEMKAEIDDAVIAGLSSSKSRYTIGIKLPEPNKK